MAGNYGGIIRSGSPGSFSYVAQPGRENNPVTYVSWFDAARFSNWMHNGQGAGSTESGVYDMTLPSAAITRSVAGTIFIPTEDEWYKAAYHDASAGTAGAYFSFATSTNSIPISDKPADNTAAVNYYNDDGLANGFNDGFAVSGLTGVAGGTNPLTDVGAYSGASSPYGTFDQNGNVFEWNEAVIGSSRGIRGGAWGNYFGISTDLLRSTFRSSGSFGPGSEGEDLGFRVASPVPEPASAALLALGGFTALHRRRFVSR